MQKAYAGGAKSGASGRGKPTKALGDRSRSRSTEKRQAALGAVSWTPQADLDLKTWLVYGSRFGEIGRNVAWWIGDWLRYGNDRFGEKYARAAKITGYDVQSLMNMAYVAGNFDVSRRRVKLSWSHHAEVASQPQDEQEKWLDLAERERLSVRSLRLEVRTARLSGRSRQDRRDSEARSSKGAPGFVVCPNCNEKLMSDGLIWEVSAPED